MPNIILLLDTSVVGQYNHFPELRDSHQLHKPVTIGLTRSGLKLSKSLVTLALPGRHDLLPPLRSNI